MGTSTSFRAPPVPRWQAFTIALQTGLPLERVRSELFNAGADWERELATPAVAAFAVAIGRARDVLPERLAGAEAPERVLAAYVAEARAASAAEGGSAALAVAERAFAAMLTRAAAGDQSLSGQDGAAVAGRLGAALERPGEAVVVYVGEVLGQYARHVVAREAGRLTEGPEGASVADTRRTARRLAGDAAQVSRELRAPRGDPESIRTGWDGLVRDAFQRGRRLPREPA